MKVLAVDVGGSHVSCGAIEDQRLLEVVSVPADSSGGLTALLDRLPVALENLQVNHGPEFVGIGFGFCGLVDTAAGRVASTNHKYSDATSVDLQAWARDRLRLPLVLENDTRMALLGELHAGVGAGCHDAVMMTLGTGIGSAAMIEGKLLRGRHGQAGCLGGHFTVDIDGRLCSCGARGCFEAEASTFALNELCRTWPGIEASPLAAEANLDFSALFRCAHQGDAAAIGIRSKCIRIWSACALSLVHAYDPELLILGGGVMKSSFPILAAIQAHLDAHAWTPWGKVQVKTAALGSNAALLGALPLFSR
jgi:glucokinase